MSISPAAGQGLPTVQLGISHEQCERIEECESNLHRRPGTADRLRKMRKVDDEKSLAIFGRTLDSYTASADTSGIEGRCRVDTEVKVTILSLYKTHTLSISCRLVTDISAGGVNIVVVAGGVVALDRWSVKGLIPHSSHRLETYREETKLLKKVGRVVAVGELIGLDSGCG